MESSSSTSLLDSGVETPIKRRKLEEKNTTQAIIVKMLEEIGRFSALVRITESKSELEDEDYRRLYRLYLAALKALTLLETERGDLEDRLKPLPTYVERVLQSSNDNVRVWSQYFYKNASPDKIKCVKTVPSPAIKRIGGLLHSVGSYIGLTAEAICSNKQKKENFKNMERLLEVTKDAITDLEHIRDNIVKRLDPYMKEMGEILTLDNH